MHAVSPHYNINMEAYQRRPRVGHERSKSRKRKQKEKAAHARKYLQLSYRERCEELLKEKKKCDMLSRYVKYNSMLVHGTQQTIAIPCSVPLYVAPPLTYILPQGKK